MKLIPKNNIQNVSVNLETYIYRGLNLITQDIEKIWKSTGTSGVLTLTVSSGDCVTLYNHNADNTSITIQDLSGSTLAGPYTTDLSSYTYGNNNLWQEYTAQTSLHNIVVTLTNARENPLYCGVAFAGDMVEFRNPNSLLDLSYINNNVQYKLSSRSEKQLQKNIKKRFDTKVILTLEDDWFDTIQYLKNNVGFTPVPWLILDSNYTTHNIYGYLDDFQQGTYNSPLNTSLPFGIIEQ